MTGPRIIETYTHEEAAVRAAANLLRQIGVASFERLVLDHDFSVRELVEAILSDDPIPPRDPKPAPASP